MNETAEHLKHLPQARFLNTHFVNELYHKNHSQLLHKHNDLLELLYVQHGGNRYIVDGMEYALIPGDVVICNAGILHGEAPFQKTTMRTYCCVVDEMQLDGLHSNVLIAPKKHPIVHFEPDAAVEKIITTLHQLHKASASNWHVCNHLANALLGMVWLEMQRANPPKSQYEPKTELLLQHIIEYLDENFAQPLNLSALGALFHLSHYYLAHIFKSAIGISPMKYVLYRRIGEAQSMLMNTNATIQAIGEQVGFSSSCHLSATFRKYVGLSPTQYRNHFKIDQDVLGFEEQKA